MTTGMKSATSLALAVLLGACSSAAGLLGKSAPDERQVTTNQSLAMPPDLNLPAPAQSDTNYAAPRVASTDPADDLGDVGADPVIDGKPVVAAPAPSGEQDIYSRYGISRVKTDGTKKNQDELIAELRAAQLAEKRRKNPNYGTIKNIGNIFKDG